MANPFLDYYIKGQDESRLQGLAAMQQRAQAVQEAGALQKLQTEQAMRQRFAAAGGDPQKLEAAAMEFGGPTAALAHLDRQQRAKDTKEMALSRLSQMAANAENVHERAMAGLKGKAERDAETARHNRILEQINAEKLKYDTGAVINIPPAATPQSAPVPPTAPIPTGMLGPQAFNQAAANLSAAAGNSNVANEAPAIRQAELQPNGGGMIPTANVVEGSKTPQNAPQAPQTPPPATPVASSIPQMPDFIAKAPKKIQDKWLANQASGTAPDSVVDAILAGRMQMPTGFALRSPYWQNVIERVAQKDPNFDATKYGARAAAARTFASGPEARNVTALNTVIGHLGTLDEAATALDNKDLRALNAVSNRLATELGDPRIVNFDTARQAVAEETMRVFRQVGASEMEAKRWGELISSSSSPKQLKGNIATLGNLLDSRVKAISQQYERTVNQSGNPARVDPENLKTLERLRGNMAQTYSDPEKEKRYQEWKARQK